MEDFERIDELTKERRLERRRKRRNKLLWHVALCSAVVVIFLCIASVWLKTEANEQAAAQAAMLKRKVEKHRHSNRCSEYPLKP